MRGIIFSIALGVMALASPAIATTINFDDLTAGTEVTNQYAGVTFYAPNGVQVFSQDLGSSPPNFICAGGCSDDLTVSFATPVSGLSYVAVGDDDSGVNGLATVFGVGDVVLGTAENMGDGNPYTPYTVDLASFGNVSKIIISTTDRAGLGYDDFTFSAASVSAAPEPSTWALTLGGIGILGGLLRIVRGRRREDEASALIAS